MDFSNLKFEIHPSVVIQLGEDLISDVIQALIELVKNSYDADASYSKLTVDTDWSGKIKKGGDVLKGRITIEDDGFGMDEEAIKTGWLTIANSPKRQLKLDKGTTDGGRTPLGDKGLGRLGVQRLGEYIEIFTKTKSSKDALYIAFSWLDFLTAEKLSDVNIIYEVIAPEKQKIGTKIIISGLKEINQWQGDTAYKRLETELSAMISPFSKIREFTVYAKLDGKKIELVELSEKVREIAPITYSLKFDGLKFSIQGKARFDYWKPDKKKELPTYTKLIEEDSGKGFYQFLTQNKKKAKKAKDAKIIRSASDKWFLEFSKEIQLEDLAGLHFIDDATGFQRVANPGSFHGEIDSFNLGNTAGKQSVFDRHNDFKAFVKELSGIKIFRDGFAIRLGEDWLKLSKSSTSGGSYYGLRPVNTVGFIALSAQENMVLEEMTDREGFKATPYYLNFYQLLSSFKSFANDSQEFMRRGFDDYKKTFILEKADITPSQEPEEIVQAVSKRLKESTVSKTADSAKDQLEKIKKETESESAQNAIQEVINKTIEIKKQSTETSNLHVQLDALNVQVSSLQDQISEMYEAVSLGITAEALAHELFNSSDNLSQKANETEQIIQQLTGVDKRIKVFVEFVNSIASSLRKQISYLSPSLRYVRDKKEAVNLFQFLTETIDANFQRLEKKQITALIAPSNNQNHIVLNYNKGKLIQIIENFILNSEYWLQEDIKHNRIEKGEIHFDLSNPFLTIWDNGSGVLPDVENSLFEPFVTRKSGQHGRGLGLFIVERLLDSEGCTVDLMPERNVQNRLFKFQLNLQGALSE